MPINWGILNYNIYIYIYIYNWPPLFKPNPSSILIGQIPSLIVTTSPFWPVKSHHTAIRQSTHDTRCTSLSKSFTCCAKGVRILSRCSCTNLGRTQGARTQGSACGISHSRLIDQGCPVTKWNDPPRPIPVMHDKKWHANCMLWWCFGTNWQDGAKRRNKKKKKKKKKKKRYLYDL